MRYSDAEANGLALFVLLLSTPVCYQPTELILDFFVLFHHFISENTGKISIVFEDFSRNSVYLWTGSSYSPYPPPQLDLKNSVVRSLNYMNMDAFGVWGVDVVGFV